MSFKTLCAITCLLAGSVLSAQQSPPPAPQSTISFDVGATIATERSKPDPSRCCFWFKGGGIDAAATFWKGFGVAVTVTGDQTSDYLPSTGENKISFLAGPRYTWNVGSKFPGSVNARRFQLFGQGLVGVAHGFDTQFSTGTTSANELAVQTGGGLNIFLTRNFGIRPAEIEYVRTQIGTTGFSTQNDLRVAAGVTFRFGTGRSHR